MGDDTRVGILGAVSDWLKLLALVVLVAEAIIIIAMKFTPESNPLVRWYPLFMLLFLVVIVIGIFIDRYTQTKLTTQTLVLGSRTISVDPSQNVATTQEVKRYDVETMYVDNPNGFMFARPKLPKWSEPQYMNMGEVLLKGGMINSLDEWEKAKAAGSIIPLGKMNMEAKFVLFEYDSPIKAQLTDESSNKVLEGFLNDLADLTEKEGDEVEPEALKEMRKQILRANGAPEEFDVQNTFFVSLLDKSLAKNSALEANLGNVFLAELKLSGEMVDSLAANQQSILWGSKQTLTNVLVNGKPGELTTYRYNQLLEGRDRFYRIGIVFSPQTDSSISVWEELQSMVKSFRVIV